MGEQKKSHKSGKNKRKCDLYQKEGILERHKLINVLRGNGPEQCLKYAEKYQLLASLRGLRKMAPKLFERAIEKSEDFKKYMIGR